MTLSKPSKSLVAQASRLCVNRLCGLNIAGAQRVTYKHLHIKAMMLYREFLIDRFLHPQFCETFSNIHGQTD